jgi:hypothetical protein
MGPEQKGDRRDRAGRRYNKFWHLTSPTLKAILKKRREKPIKKLLFILLIFIIFMGMINCTSYMDKYHQGKKKIHFYHGHKLLDRFISILSSTTEEIEFKIRMRSRQKYLYHLIIDEEEERIAEGWVPAFKVGTEYYTVRMKAKKGLSFQPGKKYRLCVGSTNPDLVYYHTSKYECFIDYEFVLPGK